VWVQDTLTKRRLIPNYTLLSGEPNVITETSFKTPCSANKYVEIGVGVLITSPKCGDQFSLDKMTVQLKSYHSHGHPHSHPHPTPHSHGHPHSHPHPTPHLHPTPHSPPHLYPPRSPCTSPSNSSSSSSSSSNISNESHNSPKNHGPRKYHTNDTKYKDPYYSCTDDSAVCCPVSSSMQPSIPNTQNTTPVSIYDLQMSLGNMISQLDK
jgi:hypothetical protein